MISNELKARIAQNCPGYTSRNSSFMSSVTELAQSCDNCANYVRGKCVKRLFDSIKEDIRKN
ncbi:hypothetical protein ACER0A_000405 [Haloimpatiens sp. FM7315]|uniref:hypothetical protein n=1 Tax=Haloimpatiens sp. FM7315 TaxID=3298609 RepID=UPI0035A34223